jgi:hypothetical protein
MATQTKKSLLIAVESIDVNDSSGTKGRVALIQNMVKLGYDLTVLHYTQKEVSIPGTSCVFIKENRRSWNFLMSRVQRYLYRWFKWNISEYQERRTGFSFTWKNDANAFAKAINTYDPADFDMLWTFGKGTSFRPHAGALKLPQWHAKWYAYVHDPYPQHLYPRPYNFVEAGYKQKRYFFREMTEKAKYMVFPSLLLKEWMQSYFVAIETKALIVPHQIAEVASPNEAAGHEVQGRFSILHAGNLLDLRDPQPLVEAYKKFLLQVPEAYSDTQLTLIGKPSKFDTYLKAQQSTMPNLKLSDGYVAFEKVHRLQQQANINIILEAKSEISPFLPGKFAHCVAADAPIFLIGPYYSECKRLLGEEYPYLFEFSEIEQLTTSFVAIYSAWKQGNIQTLNRPDLKEYLTEPYLLKTLENSLAT